MAAGGPQGSNTNTTSQTLTMPNPKISKRCNELFSSLTIWVPPSLDEHWFADSL